MSKKQQELPTGWVWARIGEVYDLVGGGTPSTDTKEYWNGDIPWVTSADIHGLRDIQPRKQVTRTAVENSATNVVPEKSLIVVTRVGLGKVALTEVSLCFSQDIHALVGNSSIIFPDYLLYYLAQAVQIFKYQNRGTTIAGVTKKQLAELPFAFPPLAEQQCIVEAIEQQFSRLDAGVAILRQIQKRLKKYRAALLKAAVEGKLTADWRAAHPDAEPASELLKRILAERRAKWEEEQMAKGRDPDKMKYVEPAAPDVRKLPALPEGWCWARAEQIANIIGGVTKGRDLSQRETTILPYLRVANVQRGYVDSSVIKTIEVPIDEIQKYKLQRNDIVLIEGGDADKLGRAAIWDGSIENCIHQNHIFRVRLVNNDIMPEWFTFCANSEQGKTYFWDAAKQTVNLASINLTQLKSFPFPFPPLAEQQQIVSIIEERLSIIGNLEAAIEKALKWAERLRQSILRQAFSGKLVAQDPNDEPAGVLLERIRQEREQAARQKQEQVSRSRPSKAAHSRRKSTPARNLREPEKPGKPVDTAGLEQQSLWQGAEVR